MLNLINYEINLGHVPSISLESRDSKHKIFLCDQSYFTPLLVAHKRIEISQWIVSNEVMVTTLWLHLV